MVVETDQFEVKEVLRVKSPELPFLASAAAIAICKIIAKKDVDTSPLKRLSSLLKNSFDVVEPSGRTQSFLDPATLSVLGDALTSSTDIPLSNMDDLISRAIDISNRMPENNNREDQTSLEATRDFCVALSRSAASFHKSLMEQRPAHPFRRSY